MANKIQKPSRERGLRSGGLVALTVALALVASLLYAQPVIRAYSWIAAVAPAPHRGPSGLKPSPVQTSGAERSHCSSLSPRQRQLSHHGCDEQMFGAEEQFPHEGPKLLRSEPATTAWPERQG